MVRKGTFLIGAGLALMWWIGLSLDSSATILWFDAVAAVIAFGIGGLVDDSVVRRSSYATGPALLGIGLAAVWIGGMAARMPAWANWLNFVFAAACLGLAVAAGSRRHVQAELRV